MSRVFAKVMKQLNIKHQVSSAYHPQSQGAIERFHQTIKSMLRTFCVDHEKEWDEHVPLLLFAVRNTTQASLGFSPSELVFGHTVRGPLKILQEQILSSSRPSSTTNVLDYVSAFRECLHTVWKLAKHSRSSVQSQMKSHYDQKAVSRSFQAGDKVLILLPVPGSALQAKFTGTYEIKEKLGDTDYVVNTPDRRRKSRVCHINMLKAYMSCSDSDVSMPVATVVPVTMSLLEYSPESDGLKMNSASFLSARLPNSETLLNLSKKFHKQINYSTIEKEALALILALQHFEVYVGSSSQSLTVYTDHNPLVFLQRMSNANHRLMRWSLICQSYNLVICHKKGIDNVIADSLSCVNQ